MRHTDTHKDTQTITIQNKCNELKHKLYETYHAKQHITMNITKTKHQNHENYNSQFSYTLYV